MHPWTKAYKDLYSTEEVDEMIHTWYSREELKRQQEYDEAWTEIRRTCQKITDCFRAICKEYGEDFDENMRKIESKGKKKS